jgi:hypothetical protein
MESDIAHHLNALCGTIQIMSDSPVNLSTGLPETALPPAPAELLSALEQALQSADPRPAIAEVCKQDPTFLMGWARLSEHARDDVEGYAYARVGYHRGLDALRRAGWKGNGYARWREETNQGFLRCLFRLQQRATAIGENVEAERCAMFLRQLDPQWQDLA